MTPKTTSGAVPQQVSRHFPQVFGCDDVAQALVPAASALVPTPAFDTGARPRTSVETSLDAAGTSACATVRWWKTELDELEQAVWEREKARAAARQD